MRETEARQDKIPPQNIEAEQSVLGAILLDNDALHEAVELLKADDFYRESHRKIYQAMSELYSRNEPVDLITLNNYLKGRNELEEVGGVQYLSSLASFVPTSANVKYHSRIVREKALVRNLLHSVTDIAKNVYDNELDTDELIDYAEKKIFDLSDKKIKTSFFTMKELISDTFVTIERLYDKKESITGIPSGFKDMDELTTGFQKGDLIIIGGRPGMGKTAFCLNISQHVGISMKEPVAIFSLEMAKEQLVMRMLCSEAKVDSNKVRKGFINKRDDWNKLTNAAGKLAESLIFIDDSSGLSVLEMRAKARRLKQQHGLSLVIVDYLQLMRGRGKFERREQEIAEISRSLKALAKELQVPVIALSQLNRGVETRGGNKNPTLADLRESGAIEQDADVIIFLYRDTKDDMDSKGRVIVDIAKQRNGPTDKITLTFLDYCTRFVDSSDVEYQEMEETF
ncbi:MAG: replicative DNA helicase [Nitrospirae bacterium]|nr:replicative DNA helicase [Nitrospirota bacterium]